MEVYEVILQKLFFRKSLETIELFYAESTRRNLPRYAQARSYLCFILFFQQQELLKINKFFIFKLIF
jgi:hypothetical protein